MKKFLVTLDPTKCLSYTLPDGRKFLPSRSKVMSEGDIGPFVSAGVFLIQPHSSDVEHKVVEKKVLPRFKRKKVQSPEINPDDKLDVEEDKEDSR